MGICVGRSNPPKCGGLPLKVWQDRLLQEYICSGGVFGYVGHYYRTIRTDRIVVKAWKRLGMTYQQIAEGITWGGARHMADEFYPGCTNKYIYTQVISCGKYLLSQGL